MIEDGDVIYGTIIPAYQGPALTWKPRCRAAFYEEDPFYPVPRVDQGQATPGMHPYSDPEGKPYVFS